MGTDESAANGDEMEVLAAALKRKGPEMACLLVMLQEHCWNNWKEILRKLRAADPTNPTPAEWADFKDYAFRPLKERGFKDPAAALAFQVQLLDAKAAAPAPSKVGSPAEIAKVAAERKSEREPVALENRPATTSAASPPHPALRKATFGTTKAEVLSYAKAAVEAHANPRSIAEILACAHEDFHASQGEIARKVGRDRSWVSRRLKWRRSGYKEASPSGPTTRSGRAALRKHKKDDSSGSAEQLDVDGYISSPAREPPTHEPPTLPASVNENPPSGSTQTESPPKAAATTSKTKGPKTTDPVEDADHKPDPSVSCQQPEKQQLPAKKPRVSPKLSPERMLIVIEALRECPILSHAAAKAGIHPKTLSYWLQHSKAGDDGYDIVWRGDQDRFHELCDDAIADAIDTVRDAGLKIAFGVKFEGKPVFLNFGHERVKAYTQDENGNCVEVPLGRPNSKMLRFMMEWLWPEKYGKHSKRDIPQTSGVLVIGERTEKPERPKSNYVPSVRARKWKSLARKVRGAEA